MSFRRRPASSCREASPLYSLWLLPLLILLLIGLTPIAIGQCKRNLGKDECGRLLPFSLCLTVLWWWWWWAGEADDDDMDPCVESCCKCLNLETNVPRKNVSSVNMLRPGDNCERVQVIATMNDGKKRCLDPNSSMIRRLVIQILEGS
ncbi:platelet basic protein-like [Acomys russatus]|uniref:platelet basic protein-like n=1 Tax=Acomys russatus TaxID=60746 RepID=UPI0021E2B829|nr:platelet basic protein-like [Acomys russatus]